MSALFMLWALFGLIAIGVSVADYFVITHAGPTITVRSALRWTALWVALAFVFAGVVSAVHPTGAQTATLFISGYLTEYSLSVDNLFIFLIIFSMLGVRPEAQPKLLKLGIYLSIVLRVIFIFVGVALVDRFQWMLYLFGILLIWTAGKMISAGHDNDVDPTRNPLYRLANKWLPLAKETDDDGLSLFVSVEGQRRVTKLFLAFLVIGSTDVLFAIDSIPAIMGISTDTFVVITSNVFAVLGLNALFFALRGVINLFKFLKHGVSLILFFIGIKMTLPGAAWLLTKCGLESASKYLDKVDHFIHDRTWLSLVVIAAFLSLSILASIVHDAVTKNKQP